MCILQGTCVHWGRKPVEGGSEDWLQIAYSFGYNISFNGKYMEYHISNGIIVSTEVKSSTYVYTRWAYKPLQFGMK